MKNSRIFTNNFRRSIPEFRFNRVLAVVFILLITACSNDFLKVEQKIEVSINDTIRLTNLDLQQAISLNLESAGNAKWRILQFPSWITVSPLNGNFSNGKSSFQIQQDPYQIPLNYGVSQLSFIFDVDGIGLIEAPLLFLNAGNPVIQVSTNFLNMREFARQSFSIANQGGGYYFWNISEKPSWLNISKEQGVIELLQSEILEVTVDPNGLGKGEHSGKIKISGNSINNPVIEIEVVIRVAEQVVQGDNLALEGDVTDAEYCKNTDLLVIAVKNPNRIYFSKSGEPLRMMELNKVPSSLAISESGDLVALISTNAQLDLIDPVKMEVSKTLQAGMNCSDIVLGNNGWAYLAPKQDESYYPRSINLKTGENKVGKAWIRGVTYMKKVPGKNLIVGTRVGWSPDGLILLDISKGAARDTVNEYHMDTWKFWFSESGDRMYCGTRNIYATPEFNEKQSFFAMERPDSRGQLEAESFSISAIEHCQSLNELFVAMKTWNSYGYEESIKIDVYNAEGVFRKRTFIPGYNKIADSGATRPTYDVPFMFAEKSGNHLILVKRSVLENKNYWFLETLNLK